MRAFVDQHRDRYGVEPICKVLRIAPSGYRRHAARARDPDLHCARAKRDEALMTEIRRVWEGNLKVYGADKVWMQMNREGEVVARCTVERLFRRIKGYRRIFSRFEKLDIMFTAFISFALIAGGLRLC